MPRCTSGSLAILPPIIRSRQSVDVTDDASASMGILAVLPNGEPVFMGDKKYIERKGYMDVCDNDVPRFNKVMV